MATNPETKLTRKIVDALKAEGVWCFKKHGNQFGSSGVPDLICCVDGRFLAIEVKHGTRVATKLQEVVIEQINKRGGVAGVARNVDEAVALVRQARARAGLGGNRGGENSRAEILSAVGADRAG